MENKDKIINLILLIISFLLVIGTYAAMFIPATVGEELREISLFSSPFWTSMFFLFLWKLLNKKAFHGFIIGLIIGVIIWFVAAFYLSSNAEKIEAMEKESNTLITE